MLPQDNRYGGWAASGEIDIVEAGWATTASEFGARANEASQTRYYHEIREWAEKANMTVFFFEAFDEPWKGDPDNPLGAEKHWGIFFVDRTPKQVMQRQATCPLRMASPAHPRRFVSETCWRDAI